MRPPDYLFDTNVLLRTARRRTPDQVIVQEAVMRLTSRRAKLCVTMQNIAEYWNVATRPVAQNGFGLSIDEAEREIRAVERGMVLLPDSEFVYRLWRKLILSHRVSGKQVHDARLVASMRVHGVRHLLTLNTADFRRYSGIVPVHPSEIR